MHDLYWMLPVKADFWNKEEVHNISSCFDPETGWKEGWAEFFSAAVQNLPNINGQNNSSGYNIEYSYHPTAITNPLSILTPEELGQIKWHKDILSNDSLDLKRDYNEGENAAVLWDIFDEKGWEYLPEAEQTAKPDEWDRDLMWYDRLEDSNLDKIWSILKDHEPDCLMDEDDAANPIKIEDKSPTGTLYSPYQKS
ncbi:MAG: hypothetical protein ACYDIA_26360 [Candidatus Humimicrobiaceae bacterium]